MRFLFFGLIFILVTVNGQCIHPLNVVFLYASNNTYTNGYVMSHEVSRENMRLNFIENEDCNYITSYYDAVDNDNIIDIVSGSIQKDYLNIFIATSYILSDQIFNILKNGSLIPPYDYYFLIRTTKTSDHNRLFTYDTNPYEGIGVLGCKLAMEINNEDINDLRIGYIRKDIESDLIGPLSIKTIAEEILDEEKIAPIKTVSTNSYENPLLARGAIQLHLDNDTNCILYSSIDTIFSNIYASKEEVYSIGLYFDVRSLIAEDETPKKTSHILFSIIQDYTALFTGIIKYIDAHHDDNDFSYIDFYENTAHLFGFSSMFNKTHITELKSRFDQLQNEVLNNTGENCKVNTQLDIVKCDYVDIDPIINFFEVTHIDEDSVIIPIYMRFTDTETIVLMVLTSIFLVLCIISGIDLVFHWNSNVVRSASKNFLFLSLVGVMLQGISLFFWIGKATAPTCILRFWFFGIGYSLVFSCIFAKNYRVWRIFSEKESFKRIEILDIHLLLKFVFVIVGIEILFLTIWTAIPSIRPFDSYQQLNLLDSSTLEHYSICKLNKVFSIIFIALKFILLLPMAFISYHTRFVDKTYKESQMIAYTIYSTFIVGALISILIASLGDHKIKTTIISYGILIIVITIYATTFIPKHYRLHISKKESDNSSNNTGQISFKVSTTT